MELINSYYISQLFSLIILVYFKTINIEIVGQKFRNVMFSKNDAYIDK